jgi:hypothetical protein
MFARDAVAAAVAGRTALLYEEPAVTTGRESLDAVD